MIESKAKREELIETLKRWAEATKITPYLKTYDIPLLASSIITIFYPTCLTCGHWVKRFDEGVNLEMVDFQDGNKVRSYGTYCEDCAEYYLSKGEARRCEN